MALSKKTTTTNVNETINDSDSAAGQSNNGAVVSTVADGAVTINLEEVTPQIVGPLVSQAAETHKDNLNTFEFIVSEAGGAIKNLIVDTLAKSERDNQRFLDAAAAANARADGTVRDALQANTDVTVSVLDFAEDLNTENQSFLKTTFQTFVGTVEEFNEEAALNRSESIEAIEGLSETVVTGGENLQANMNKLIAVASLVTVGFVTWAAFTRA